MDDKFKPTQINLAKLSALIQARIPIYDICDQLNCSERTVYRWQKKFREENEDAVDNRKFNHRPRLYSEEQIQEIRTTMSNEFFLPVTH